MSVPRVNGPEAQASSRRPTAPAALPLMLVLVLMVAPLAARAIEAAPPDHLVVSEIVTGGGSASDELIELYNPTVTALPLEGLELVYVTASGATVSRRAAWEVGAPSVPPGGHVLVANEAGIYAPVADVLYASGLAATGGSLALRIVGASTAIDAVGWGSAASTWIEGSPAAAPSAGASIERLPGGAAGSTQDTDDNAADFVENPQPDPQNLASPVAPAPGGTPPPPPPPPTAEPTPVPTAPPVPSEDPALGIAAARALPDGSVVTVEGVSLTDADFHDGGGYVADSTGGIAVLLADGSFAAGSRLRVSGVVEDRFSQRTIRAAAAGVVDLGPAVEPAAAPIATGGADESREGSLVRITAAVAGAPSTLTSGLAFDLDDGSGAVRVIVGTATGIDTTTWLTGATVEVIGVLGQRDSSGSGSAGYRVQPRRPADVVSVVAPQPSPSVGGSAGASPTVAPSGAPDVIPIAQARAAAKNARVTVRGIVTHPSGLLDVPTAVIQDGTGAIVLRLSDEAGGVALGEWLEVAGTRSTKSGMETIRVVDPPVRLGTADLPPARALRTGAAGEQDEATLVVVRGAIAGTPRRSTSQNLSFEVDDGSGPLRVVADDALGLDATSLPAGTWVEVRGVLGQETSGSQPLRGYRIWPARAGDVRVVAATTDAGAGAAEPASSGGSSADDPALADLGSAGAADLSGLTVGATLVAGPWPELGLGGLLWDGRRLVGIAPRSAARLTAAEFDPPVRLELRGLRGAGAGQLGLPLVALGEDPGDVVATAAPVHVPVTRLPGAGSAPAWISLVGRLQETRSGLWLTTTADRVAVEHRCPERHGMGGRVVRALGIGAAEPARLVVACDGLVPAPTLTVAATGAVRTASLELEAPPDGGVPPEPRERVPGVVLLGAAASLLAAAMAARFRRTDDPETAEAARSPVSSEPDAHAPPHLALVRLPHERG